MSHVSLAYGPFEESLKIGSRQIELHGDGFVFDERAEAAEQVEALVEGGANFGPVGATLDDGDLCVRAAEAGRRARIGARFSRMFSGEKFVSGKRQGQRRAGGKGQAALKEVSAREAIRLHRTKSDALLIQRSRSLFA